jgi:NitT/TauT family transport system substrate-binding protein
VVDDFLLTLALESKGLKREDVIIKGLPTDAAATAFASGQADAVGAFPPFWSTALKREGSKELISSANFPGAIPDLLVVTQKLIDERPDQVQALVKTWFDIRAFMEKNPAKSDQIMSDLAGVTVSEFQQYKAGTRFFTLADNLEAFSAGDRMKHMPFAAEKIAKFLVDFKFVDQQPNLSKLLNDSFLQAYAKQPT